MLRRMLVALALLVTAADPRVLVLDLEAVGVEPAVAKSVDPLVLNGAAVDGVTVISQSEIKAIASVEADKAQVTGCDSSACLAELAGALGARLVLFGSVSRLGSTTTVALSVYDNATSAIVRDSLAVTDVGALPATLPSRVRALVTKALRDSRAGRATGATAATRATGTDSDSASSAARDANDHAEPAAARDVHVASDVEPPSTLFYAGLGCAVIGGAALWGRRW